MGAVKSLELITPEAYLEGEPKAKWRYEYITGRVYAMAGGSNTHNTIKTWLIGALVARLRGKPCQPFDSDTKVRIQHSSGIRFYYPDAMVVRQANSGREMFQDSPVVIVEVLSPSTRRDDEGPKRDDYFKVPTLAHYLLVETTTPRVTVYDRTNEKIAGGVFKALMPSYRFLQQVSNCPSKKSMSVSTGLRQPRMSDPKPSLSKTVAGLRPMGPSKFRLKSK